MAIVNDTKVTRLPKDVQRIVTKLRKPEVAQAISDAILAINKAHLFGYPWPNVNYPSEISFGSDSFDRLRVYLTRYDIGIAVSRFHADYSDVSYRIADEIEDAVRNAEQVYGPLFHLKTFATALAQGDLVLDAEPELGERFLNGTWTWDRFGQPVDIREANGFTPQLHLSFGGSAFSDENTLIITAGMDSYKFSMRSVDLKMIGITTGLEFVQMGLADFLKGK